MKKTIAVLLVLAVAGCILFRDEIPSQDDSLSAARDPGVRGGAAGAGAPIAGLSATELALFNAGKDDFEEQEKAADGLGPTMNLDGCAGCHLHPAVGGTSPAVNPQVAFARANGATGRRASSEPGLRRRFITSPAAISTAAAMKIHASSRCP